MTNRMRLRERASHRLTPAGPEAAEAMATLHRTAFPRGWSAEEMTRLLCDPCSLAVTAWRRKHLAGFALGRVAADETEVLSIVVAESARRRGLGEALLSELERNCRQVGARTIFLEASERNVPAMSLYYQADYRQIGRRPRYYEDGAAALIMRKTL